MNKNCELEKFKLETEVGVMDITSCSSGLHEVLLTQTFDLNKKEKGQRVTLLHSAGLNSDSRSIKECHDYFNNYFEKNTNSLKDLPQICWKSVCESGSFVERVLTKLYETKFSETLSYKDLAELAGSPNACRAVGTAMRKNKIPFIISCHRVINSNGGAGNYAYGTQLKQYLLDHENI